MRFTIKKIQNNLYKCLVGDDNIQEGKYKKEG